MKNFVLLVSALFLIFSGDFSNVQLLENSYVSCESENIENVQRADVIIIKFRVYEGVTQYRHWNETQGKWVEPDWITIS